MIEFKILTKSKKSRARLGLIITKHGAREFTRILRGKGVGEFRDIDYLTAFNQNYFLLIEKFFKKI